MWLGIIGFTFWYHKEHAFLSVLVKIKFPCWGGQREQEPGHLQSADQTGKYYSSNF